MHADTLRRILRNLRPDRAVNHLRHPWCSLLKLRTDGMLGTEVYCAIYHHAKLLPDLPFVEIGAATGTATIAIARAYQDAGNGSRVLAIEKCQGGSRKRYGGYSANLAILENNLKRYGVREKVLLFTDALTDDTAPSMLKALAGEHIGGFMHDADGRLDRDFTLLWPRTIEGGLIIVDDCPEAADCEELIRARGFSGRKLYMTAAGWALIRDAGLVLEVERVGTTVFARKVTDSVGGSIPTLQLQDTILAAKQQYSLMMSRISAHESVPPNHENA